jgi:hypothetical protein
LQLLWRERQPGQRQEQLLVGLADDELAVDIVALQVVVDVPVVDIVELEVAGAEELGECAEKVVGSRTALLVFLGRFGHALEADGRQHLRLGLPV